jgi:DNA-binding SARP family transcriptional activator
LRTLGSFSIEVDGTPQPGRSGQPSRSALLLLLALDREVTRESATALLWPESDDERARQAMRQTLYLLRRDLGTGWLDSSRDSLRATTRLTADAHELAVLRENPIHPAAVDFLMLPVDCGAMISWLFLVRRALTGMVRSRASLAAQNALLRHQVAVLQRERTQAVPLAR